MSVPPFLALLRSDRSRTIGIDQPFATLVSEGSGHALVQPQPASAPGDADGGWDAPPLVVGLEGRATVAHVRPVDKPLRAQTGRQQDALVVPMRNHGNARPAATHPLPTVTASGNHHGLLTWPQLLVPYYSSSNARPADQPLGTLPTRDHFALLGSGIATSLDPMDCYFRMLEPTEIQAGMAFQTSYEILGTRRERVRQAGNAVTPPAARDLIAALAEAITGQEPMFRADRFALAGVGA